MVMVITRDPLFQRSYDYSAIIGCYAIHIVRYFMSETRNYLYLLFVGLLFQVNEYRTLTTANAL